MSEDTHTGEEEGYAAKLQLTWGRDTGKGFPSKEKLGLYSFAFPGMLQPGQTAWHRLPTTSPAAAGTKWGKLPVSSCGKAAIAELCWSHRRRRLSQLLPHLSLHK